MKILGIETSCDDTGIAVLEQRDGHIFMHANVVSSQIEIHQEYGGVYPMLAKRAHEQNLPAVLEQAIQDANLNSTNPAIDAIAITYGPGLSPCLWTGIHFATHYARKWNVPLVPVNHIEGHLLVGLLSQTNETSNFEFRISKKILPAVALIVSGGHTQLVLVHDIGTYEIIGETRDDAAGEAFDKTARILGLPYPGGPAIAAEAVKFKMKNEKFKIAVPRPMMHAKNYDFSFSGLKTAVLYDYQARPKKERESKEYIREMAAEIQQAIIDVLIAKTMRAAKEYGAKSIVLGGGVSANDELRNQFGKKINELDMPLFIPPKHLSTDNGAMIALAGIMQYSKGAFVPPTADIEANPNLRLQ